MATSSSSSCDRWRPSAAGGFRRDRDGLRAPDDVDRALAAGYQLHLSKPMDPMALIEAVARLSRENV